jgi:type II secretory pathway pseudopilin PulG
MLEVIVSIAVFVVVITFLYPTVAWLVTRSRQLQYGSEAATLLQSGQEVAYNIFLGNWSAYGNGRYKYTSGNIDTADSTSPQAWKLVSMAASEVETVGRFSRYINIYSACRLTAGTGANIGKLQVPPQANPGCQSGYSIDTNSKVVVTTVSWIERGSNKQISASLLVVKI